MNNPPEQPTPKKSRIDELLELSDQELVDHLPKAQISAGHVSEFPVSLFDDLDDKRQGDKNYTLNLRNAVSLETPRPSLTLSPAELKLAIIALNMQVKNAVSDLHMAQQVHKKGLEFMNLKGIDKEKSEKYQSIKNGLELAKKRLETIKEVSASLVVLVQRFSSANLELKEELLKLEKSIS